MTMIREGDVLVVGVEPERPGGRLVAVVPTRPLPGPPPGSSWRSLDDLKEPLVECYDALGVGDDHVYVLTIDRDPWDAAFVQPSQLYCEYFEAFPGARLDSVLHVRECQYRWRPLRRERIR